MDLDILAKKFSDLERRLSPLLDEYERSMAHRAAQRAAAADANEGRAEKAMARDNRADEAFRLRIVEAANAVNVSADAINNIIAAPAVELDGLGASYGVKRD